MKAFSLLAIAQFICLYSLSQSPHILVPFRTSNKWGYSDTLGKIKIKPTYDTVSLFDYDLVRKDNHVIAEVIFDGKPMVVNEKGRVIVPAKYDYIRLITGLEEPTFIISKNNKFGLFSKGKELFPPISDYMPDPYPGFYEVHTNNKAGLINSNGKIVIPIIYDQVNIGNFKEPDSIEWKCVRYGKGEEVRVVKLPEENRLPQKPADTEELSDIIAYEDFTKTVDSAKSQYGFDSVSLTNNLGVVYKDSVTGVLLPYETKKVCLFSKRYTLHHLKYFSVPARNNRNKNSAAYIIVSLNNKYGIINEREEHVLPFAYDGIEEKDGVFLLKRDNKIGFFIWNTIYPVIQPAYDEYLWKQYIPVNSKWRFILFKVKNNGRTGFVGENGVPYFKD